MIIECKLVCHTELTEEQRLANEEEIEVLLPFSFDIRYLTAVRKIMKKEFVREDVCVIFLGDTSFTIDRSYDFILTKWKESRKQYILN